MDRVHPDHPLDPHPSGFHRQDDPKGIPGEPGRGRRPRRARECKGPSEGIRWERGWVGDPLVKRMKGGTPGRERFRRCDVWRLGTRVEDSKRIVERSTPMECETIGRIGATFTSSEILPIADSRKLHPRGFPGTRIVVVPQRICSRSL